MKLNILLIGGFLIVAILCGIVGLVATGTFGKVQKINAELQEDFVPQTILMVEMQKKAYKIYSKGMQYIIHRKWKEKAAETKEEMKEAMDELKELGDKHFEYSRYLSMEKRKNAQQILDKVAIFNYAVNGTIDFIDVQVGATEEINEKIAKIEDKTVYSAYRILADDLMEQKIEHMQELKDANKTVTEAHISSRNIIIITTLIIVILSITLGLAISRSVTRQIDELKENAREIGKGNLDTRIKIKSKNEIGELAAAFNQMADDLKLLSESEREKSEALQKLTDELEIKVADRTKGLDEKVQKLNKSQKAMLYMVEDLNKTTKELKTAQEGLVRKERLATLGQFSGSISHELRNPLGVIDSSIYYLKMRLKDTDEKVNQHLERIKSSVDSSTSIIQSLLNLTRMKKPLMSEHELKSIVSDSISTSNVPVTVKVNRRFPEEEVPVHVEKEQIRMALKNVIMNAVDAMKEEGTLTVTIQKDRDGRAEISFQDTGGGIDPENMDKIFQPLFSTKAQGIGFGLSISRMIVENHDGTIRVESEFGQGAKFIISLPMDKEKVS